MKKWLGSIGLLATCCFMLTGCHMSHEWQEATCTTPRTCLTGGETEGEALGHTWIDATCSEPKHCSVCGETEGEPLEHTWVEATCSEPKHCSVCGEIEGEALAHTWIEANYQQPATCEVCGVTEGEPLQADFEKYGLNCNTDIDTPHTYKVPDYDTNKLTATGEVTFTDYEIFESDNTHEALDSYEWRAVTMTIVLQNGRTSWNVSDYYNIEAYDSYDENADTYTVNYNGIDYTECLYDEECYKDIWEGDVYTWQWRVFFRVPEGYDGRVIYVFTPENKNNGEYINDIADDNTVFFLLK